MVILRVVRNRIESAEGGLEKLSESGTTLEKLNGVLNTFSRVSNDCKKSCEFLIKLEKSKSLDVSEGVLN